MDSIDRTNRWSVAAFTRRTGAKHLPARWARRLQLALGLMYFLGQAPSPQLWLSGAGVTGPWRPRSWRTGLPSQHRRTYGRLGRLAAGSRTLAVAIAATVWTGGVAQRPVAGPSVRGSAYLGQRAGLRAGLGTARAAALVLPGHSARCTTVTSQDGSARRSAVRSGAECRAARCLHDRARCQPALYDAADRPGCGPGAPRSTRSELSTATGAAASQGELDHSS